MHREIACVLPLVYAVSQTQIIVSSFFLVFTTLLSCSFIFKVWTVGCWSVDGENDRKTSALSLGRTDVTFSANSFITY